MRIRELAERTGVQAETIRYYEAQGLLQPAERAANNYREYRRAHFERLAFNQRCRSLDLSQDEVRMLIQLQNNPSSPCNGVNDLIDAHLRRLTERTGELEALRRQLEDIRNPCSGSSCIRDCRVLESLGRPKNSCSPVGANQH
jgi:Cd(II)/Pb(II)-responsive transcriptional regulator